MMDRDKRLLSEQYFRFSGISNQKKREWLMNTLSYCKEIRDTLYPLDNSKVTELSIVEFTATKEKDIYIVNGSLALEDGSRFEGRSFSAYISGNEMETRVYLDIVREGSNNVVTTSDSKYQKTIVTNETFVDAGDKILSITSYSGSKREIFNDEIPKRVGSLIEERCMQMGAF